MAIPVEYYILYIAAFFILVYRKRTDHVSLERYRQVCSVPTAQRALITFPASWPRVKTDTQLNHMVISYRMSIIAAIYFRYFPVFLVTLQQ